MWSLTIHLFSCGSYQSHFLQLGMDPKQTEHGEGIFRGSCHRRCCLHPRTDRCAMGEYGSTGQVISRRARTLRLAIASYSLSSVGLNVAVAPTLTVKVLSQVLKPAFSNFILWSPAASFRVEGVLPMYFSSTVMSAPSGVDLTSTEESTGSLPFALCAATADCCAIAESAVGLT